MAETTMLNLNTHSKILVIIGLLVAYIIASFTALCLGDENLNPKELFHISLAKMNFKTNHHRWTLATHYNGDFNRYASS